MAEYNSKEQTTFISTDNNQLEVIMKQNTTFTIEKKFNKKYAKSVQIRKTYIFFNMKIQYYKDVSSS